MQDYRSKLRETLIIRATDVHRVQKFAGLNQKRGKIRDKNQICVFANTF